MPAAIPIIAAVAGAAATAAAAGAVTAAGFAAFGLSVATTAAVIGGLSGAVVSFAVAAIGNAVFPVRPPRNAAIADTFDKTQQFRQPITAHRAVVGRARVSGPIVFLHTNASARNSYASQVAGGVPANYAAERLLYLVHALAGHEVDAVETILLDTTVSTDARFAGAAAFATVLGTSTQTPPDWFITETDGRWTAEHRGLGRALLYSVLRYDASIFKGGLPNISTIMRGAKVYDPRAGTVVWSRNAALVAAWYITWENGLRASWDEIDIPALIAAANICDEVVPLKFGGTELRYTANGTFDLDEAPGTVLQRLLTAMGGTAVFVGGKWSLFAAAWTPPSFTITEDMLRGPVTVRANRSARDLFNGVRAVYVRPDAGWQPADAPPLLDALALNQDGGVESYTDLALDFTVSGYRAQRLMQIALRRNRLQRQVQLPLNMAGLAIRCWDVVTLTLPRLGTDTYRVVRWSLAPEGGVDVTLEQDAASAYAWDPATDERPLGDVSSVTWPGGLAIGAPTLTVTTPTAPTFSSLDVSWTAVPDTTAYDVDWQAVGAGTWTAGTPSGTTATLATGGVANVRVRARNATDTGAYDTATAPGAPTRITGTLSAGAWTIRVTLPVGAVRAQIFYRVNDGDPAGATLLATEPTSGAAALLPPVSAGTLHVWARSVSAKGNVSALAGPGTAVDGAAAFVWPPGSGDDPGLGQGDS